MLLMAANKGRHTLMEEFFFFLTSDFIFKKSKFAQKIAIDASLVFMTNLRLTNLTLLEAKSRPMRMP